MTINGTPGNDDLTGTKNADHYDLSQGGEDTFHGLGGNDIVDFGAAFDNGDHVFGGKGFDTVTLNGATNVTLGDDSIVGVEKMVLGGGFHYQFQFADGNIAAGERLTVDASAAGLLSLIGLSESNGAFTVQGSSGDDNIETGAGSDAIFGGLGDDNIETGTGEDNVDGGAGGDTISLFGDDAFDSGDRIDGGAADGINTILLSGNYSAPIVIAANMMQHIQAITLLDNHAYSIKLAHASLPTGAGDAFTISAPTVDTASITIDGSGVKHYGGFNFYGGGGDDVLIGAGSADLFNGSGGADMMTGGGGVNTFSYVSVGNSTGPNYDTITDFDAHNDFFSVVLFTRPDVAGVDRAVHGGALSTASFNDDLKHAIGKHHLAPNDAVLFHPSSGTLAGQWFLIVDGNGQAGYQANADLVINLGAAHHIADFDLTNFAE